MAKNCLSKISTNINTNCVMPVHGIKELYLMHVADVTWTMSALNTVSNITFAAGAKSYRVEGYKQNIQVTAATRALDASNKLDVSVTFKTHGADFTNINAILSGSFYVMVVYNTLDIDPQAIGLISPLECSSVDYDSNANGMRMAITLTAPDGSAGNYLTPVGSVAAATIKSKA